MCVCVVSAEGYQGIMCAKCITGSFLKGKSCVQCPAPEVGWMLYLIAPLLMLLCWFQFFLWVIAGGIAPCLFVVYAFLQICATIGQFACDWDKAIKAVLGELGIVNFNLSFLFLDCWFGPPFIFQWIMFMLLPVSLH